jgi:hypothetical protein
MNNIQNDFQDNSLEALQMKAFSENIQESEMEQAFDNNGPIQKQEGQQKASGGSPNTTGLPNNMKSNLEQMSGMNMDDIQTHYNSAEPAKIGALAYAQGSDIHIGPGQEKHLGHEAWHVAQQKQGKVNKTTETANGTPVNDNPGLEAEADKMGAKIMKKEAPSHDQEPLQQKTLDNGTRQHKTIQKEPIGEEEQQQAEAAAENAEDAVAEGQEGAEYAQDNIEDAVEGGQEAVSDGQESLENVQSLEISGDLAKYAFKNDVYLPPIPLFFGLSLKPYFGYDIKIDSQGGLSVPDESAEINVLPHGKVKAGAKAGLDLPNINAGVDAHADAEFNALAPVKWSKADGLKAGAKMQGKLNAEIGVYAKFFSLIDFSKTLVSMDIADFAFEVNNSGIANATWTWNFNPGEDDLIDTTKIIKWFSEDNEAAAQAAALTAQEISILPDDIKATLIAKIRDIYVGSEHEEQILRLLGIVEQNQTEITHEAWLVMQSAYAKDHDGKNPTGYVEVYNWIYSKMDGDNDDTMEQAIQDKSYVDILMDGEILGDSEGMPSISITDCDLKSLGQDLSEEDSNYIINMVRTSNFDELLKGVVELPSGKVSELALNVKFKEGQYTYLNGASSSSVPNYDFFTIEESLRRSQSNF